MTIYNRPRAEVFAENAPPSEIQPFQAWLRGLGIAFDETNGFPEMTGLNGLFNALNQYIKYLEQNGFAEWSPDLEYPIGAGVRVGSVWYRARTQNTNKPPATSQNDWDVFLNAADTTYQSPLSQVSGRVRVAAATTLQTGVTRYATSTEVANRSNVSAAVRPVDIPQPAMVSDATTSTKGVVRFATANEVTNRSNVQAVITPANIGQTFGGSLAVNGWCRLPNGLVLQWGTIDEADNQGENGKTINFPSAFPTNCLNVTLTRKTASPSGDNSDGGITLYATTRTNFSIHYSTYTGSSSGSLRGFTWFAVGY